MLTHGDLRKLRPYPSDQDLVNCFQRRLYSNTYRFSGLGWFFLYQAQHKHSNLSANQETGGQWEEVSCTQSHLLSISLPTWWCFHIQQFSVVLKFRFHLKKKSYRWLLIRYQQQRTSPEPMRNGCFVCPIQKLFLIKSFLFNYQLILLGSAQSYKFSSLQ